MHLPEAFVRHASIPRLNNPAVRAAIGAGQFRAKAPCDFKDARQLLSIYRCRATHLLGYSTAHALQLRADTCALCSALEILDPFCVVTLSEIQFEDGRAIALFERADTQELLGVLSTIDQRMVSEDDWRKLWGDAD